MSWCRARLAAEFGLCLGTVCDQRVENSQGTRSGVCVELMLHAWQALATRVGSTMPRYGGLASRAGVIGSLGPRSTLPLTPSREEGGQAVLAARINLRLRVELNVIVERKHRSGADGVTE